MGEIILEIKNLRKNYKTVQAVNDISIHVERGKIYGILGPNGSGKTTTLAIVLGILQPTSGSFSWFGNGTADENRLRIGALLETPNFYPYLSAYDNLRIVARIKGISDEKKSISQTLEKVGLLERSKSKFGAFSLGMKQRLALGAALLSDPEVLVLDEPTNGLDPLGIADIRKLILSLSEEGKTIIIASHILDEMEKICNEVAIMRNGRILKVASLVDFIGEKERIHIQSDELEQVRSIIEPLGVHILKQDARSIDFYGDLTSYDYNKLLSQKGIYCSEIYNHKQTLEQAFLEIIEDETVAIN